MENIIQMLNRGDADSSDSPAYPRMFYKFDVRPSGTPVLYSDFIFSKIEFLLSVLHVLILYPA